MLTNSKTGYKQMISYINKTDLKLMVNMNKTITVDGIGKVFNSHIVKCTRTRWIPR